MARSPRLLAEQRLRTELAKARRTLRATYQTQAINILGQIAKGGIANIGQSGMVRTYATSASQMFASSFEATLKDIPDRSANTLLKAVRAIEQATIGATEAQRRDNQELQAINARYADLINEEIREAYLEQFSGRSYREGDPSRRSGGIEQFLVKNQIAQVEGQGVTVSLRAALADPDVPHIFRLNYGTESLTGAEKQGLRPPTFSIKLLPGAPTHARSLAAGRQRGFTFPGGNFSYRLNLGAQGQVQLYAARGLQGTSTGPTPSQGIAPSYFVEYGLVEASKLLPAEYKALLRRWDRRVARIRV